MCMPGWGNLVAVDWNDGREFDGKFLKNFKSPNPHPMPCLTPPTPPPPPPPRQLNIDRCISLICRIWFLVILLDMKRMLKGISMKFLIKKSRYWILVYGKSKNFENTVICMKMSTLASSSFLYVCSLRNAGKVYYNFYKTFLLMYFVSSVILQCVAVNYSIQAFKTTNVSVCVCCGLILSLV